MIGELWLLVRRSLWHHRVSTLVTSVSVGLATGLLMAVFVLADQSRATFAAGSFGFDAVLGARGSALQLVLNSVYHLETSPGNIPWALYKEVKTNRRYGVAMALPYAVGDNYKGFRIVGTTEDLFTQYQLGPGKGLTFAAGKGFEGVAHQGVLGSRVAAETGLKLGDIFRAYHGITYDETAAHDERYEVVGVLEPTGTPMDRVVWIPIDGIFRMSGHVLRGTGDEFDGSKHDGEIPDEHKEVSAVMIRFSDPTAGMRLSHLINRQGKVATLAWPVSKAVADLYDKMGWAVEVLRLVAYLVALVAAASVLASLYNTMNERRREFAIMRALGATRGFLVAAIVLEAATITAVGVVVGGLVYVVILGGASRVVWDRTGVVLEVFTRHPAMVWCPVGMILLGALAGLVPAYRAYATEVAKNLVPDT